MLISSTLVGLRAPGATGPEESAKMLAQPRRSRHLDDLFRQLPKLFERPKIRTTPDASPQRLAVSAQLRTAFFDIVTALRPDLCVEVGAFEATFSRAIKIQLPQARVVAFEANPHLFEYYRDQCTRDNVEVEYLWTAISDSVGELDFLIPTSIGGRPKRLDNSMGSLMFHQLPPAENATVRVPATSLDVFFGPPGEARSVAWIDVEGAVAKVIDGGTQFFKNTLAVFCEVETRQTWSGQLVDAQLFERFLDFDLVPVLRDCERSWQYNVILLRQDAVGTSVRTAIESYVSGVERMTSEGSGG
jgi:FkbM family methyltransferase